MSRPRTEYEPTTNAAASRSRRRRVILVLSMAIGGVSLSVLLAWLLLTREQELAKVQFKLDAGERVESLQGAVADRLGVVDTLAAFFSGSQVVNRGEFHAFTAPIAERYPGIQTLAWAPRIPAARRETHERAVRDTGFPEYRIGQRGQRGEPVAADQDDEYYPILFAEPDRENRSLIGFNLTSHAACCAAIREALSTGRPAAVVCKPLDDNEDDRSMLYVLAPAWNQNVDRSKRPADQPEIDGFVLGVFRIGTLVESALGIFSPIGIDVYIDMPFGGSGETFGYLRPSPLRVRQEPLQPADARPLSSEDDGDLLGFVEVTDSRWIIKCAPMASCLARQRTWQPAAALLIGLVITGLLVGHLVLLIGRTARVEELVARQTGELRESEQRFRRLVDNAGDAFFLHDEDWRILDVSQRACDSVGYTREELLSMTIDKIDVDFHRRDLGQYSNLPDEAYPVSFEGVHLRKDGTTFPVEVRLAPLDLGKRRLMLGLARDITDRKRNEEALRREERLLREMLELHEQERKLIAYEIHDGLAQQLTGALYKFQAIDTLRERDPDGAQEIQDEAIRLLREAMAETRRLVGGLRPPVLDESGVVVAIDYLIAEHRQHESPEIEFVHDAEFNRLAPPLESAVFRIAQECLTNACRYSHSEKVRVELRQTEGHVRIDVRDWGVGFDPTTVGTGHFGLQGIRERARLLGGVSKIEASPEQGVHVTVELPLVPQAENGTV